jgi:hypothetical protein
MDREREVCLLGVAGVLACESVVLVPPVRIIEVGWIIVKKLLPLLVVVHLLGVAKVLSLIKFVVGRVWMPSIRQVWRCIFSPKFCVVCLDNLAVSFIRVHLDAIETARFSTGSSG